MEYINTNLERQVKKKKTIQCESITINIFFALQCDWPHEAGHEETEQKRAFGPAVKHGRLWAKTQGWLGGGSVQLQSTNTYLVQISSGCTRQESGEDDDDGIVK